MTDPNVVGVQAMIADAKPLRARVLQVERDPMPSKPRHVDGQDLLPGQWADQADEFGLPPDCPVLPLGVNGDTFYFLDTIGQLRGLVESKMGQGGITALFMGRANYLYWAWPRFKEGEDFKVTGWRAERAREVLMAACARKGPWDPVDKVRGRGAWRGNAGELILHCGDELWTGGKLIPMGEMGGYVYPARPPVPQPFPKSLEKSPSPAIEILQLIRTWSWVRPDVDPVLLLGWIVAAMIAGALDWRPSCFLVGDKATGKSTLQKLIKQLLGDLLIQSVDTTGAGIYQQLGQDALPVSVDELESEADSRKQKAIIKLMRVSSSGGEMLRGGSDHVGARFKLNSAFIFSSINAPPLEPQDLSRMAVLRLLKLPAGQPEPHLDERRNADIGRRMMRRVADRWSELPGQLDAHFKVLAAAGHDGRGQRTFGTLLACAALVLGSDAEALGLPLEDLSRWGELMRADQLDELEDANENWRLCLDHILSSRPEVWRGGSHPAIGRVLEEFLADPETMTVGTVRKLLGDAGLGLCRPRPTEARPDVNGFWLAIPNQSPRLREIFEGTKWAGEPNAGVWAAALRQAPVEYWLKDQPQRINGVLAKCTLFKVSWLVGEVEGGRQADWTEEEGNDRGG